MILVEVACRWAWNCTDVLEWYDSGMIWYYIDKTCHWSVLTVVFSTIWIDMDRWWVWHERLWDDARLNLVMTCHALSTWNTMWSYFSWETIVVSIFRVEMVPIHAYWRTCTSCAYIFKRLPTDLTTSLAHTPDLLWTHLQPPTAMSHVGTSGRGMPAAGRKAASALVREAPRHHRKPWLQLL